MAKPTPTEQKLWQTKLTNLCNYQIYLNCLVASLSSLTKKLEIFSLPSSSPPILIKQVHLFLVLDMK